MQTRRNDVAVERAAPSDVSRRTLIRMAGLATASGAGPLAGLASATPDDVPDGTPRIWPVRTDASGGTCSDSRGRSHPATGPGSARWFNFGGCGTWKVFPVVGGETYYVRATVNGAILTDMSYHIQEREGGEWVTRTEHVYGHRTHTAEVDTYTPSPDATDIRIQKVDGGRGNGFYVSVYGPDPSAVDRTREFERARDAKLRLADRVDENALGLLDDRKLVTPALEGLIDTADGRPAEETGEAIRRMTLCETVTDTVLAGAGSGDSPLLSGDHDLSSATAEYALDPIAELVFVHLSVVRFARRFRTVRRALARASRAIGNFIADVLAHVSPGLSRFVRRRSREVGEVILDRVLKTTEERGKELAQAEYERIRAEETRLFVEDGSRRIFQDALFDPEYEFAGNETEPLSDSLASSVEALSAEPDGPTLGGSNEDATTAADRRRRSINDAIDEVDGALESDAVAEVLRTSGLVAASLGTIALVAGAASANPVVAAIGFASTLLGLAPTVLVSTAAWGTGFVGIVGLRYSHQLAVGEILAGNPMGAR